MDVEHFCVVECDVAIGNDYGALIRARWSLIVFGQSRYIGHAQSLGGVHVKGMDGRRAFLRRGM